MIEPPRPLEEPRALRADLHVHSFHSGFTGTLPIFRSRDCYSSPESVYRRARARGMDVVTITDHDSIDGCLELLDRHPDAADILMGEEIECRLPAGPTGVRVHLGAIGITEALHREVQPLRGNAREVAELLRRQGAAVILHHPFHFYRGEVPVAAYLDDLLPLVHAVEIRNGTMLSKHNHVAAAMTSDWRQRSGRPVGETGGSDAHVLAHVADSYTVAGPPRPAATPAAAVLDALRSGTTRAAGRHGTPGRFAYEIYGVVFNYWGGLLGFHASGLTGKQRASGMACSLVSLPFQFIPLLVSLGQKAGERRRIARWEAEGTRNPGITRP